MASPSRDQPQAHPSETLRFIERSHESELTRVGRLAHVGRNFPLAYPLMGLPGLLANVPTSRREHAILPHADGSSSLRCRIETRFCRHLARDTSWVRRAFIKFRTRHCGLYSPC